MTYAVPAPERATSPRRGRRWSARGALRVIAAGLAAVVLLTSCQGAYDLPLPGGVTGDGPTMKVRADFADVLDLVPKSAVKINDVTVGQVDTIELNGWTARVTLTVPKSSKLPDNAIAELKQSSLLGEKYIALAGPRLGDPVGTLSDGDLIPLDRTNRNPEVEEVLSAMSLLLNGGGIAQLAVIEKELANALRGNTDEIKHLIGQLNTFVGSLDKQKAEIVRAIDMVDRLAKRLADQKDLIGQTLQEMPKGLKVLADQRVQLTQMLQSLSRLGTISTKVIRGSKADLLANLKSLRPILTQLNNAGDALPQSLELLLTYPFPDGATSTIKGDYTNLWVTADLDLRSLKVLDNGVPGTPLPPIPNPLGNQPTPGTQVPSVPSVPNPAPRQVNPRPANPQQGAPRQTSPLCPPLCASKDVGDDQPWTTLYGGGGNA